MKSWHTNWTLWNRPLHKPKINIFPPVRNVHGVLCLFDLCMMPSRTLSARRIQSHCVSFEAMQSIYALLLNISARLSSWINASNLFSKCQLPDLTSPIPWAIQVRYNVVLLSASSAASLENLLCVIQLIPGEFGARVYLSCLSCCVIGTGQQPLLRAKIDNVSL